MPFTVKHMIWEPGKQAPMLTTENRALAYIEFGNLRRKRGMELARLTHEVIPVNLTGPEKFLYLVYRTRKAQEVYWSAKAQKLPSEVLEGHRKIAMQLEKELGLKIADTRYYLDRHPKSQHDEMAYNFFIVVEAWLDKFKRYFVYKRQLNMEPDVARQMKKECEDMQDKIDKYINKNIGL